MGNILVPTDFSESSINAFHYALQLYGNTDSRFHVIHFYHTAFDPTQPVVLDYTLGIEKIKKENITRMIANIPSSIKENLREDINIVGSVEMGFATEEIIKLSNDYDIIVLGNTGSHKLADKIFGSISLEVANKARCPVFLIPDSTTFEQFKDIAYACDFDEIGVEILNKIAAFVKRFNAKLHFIHVSMGQPIDFTRMLKDFDEVPYDTHIVESDSVDEGLEQFVIERDVDLLVLATKHRNFWEKILHSSVTKRIAINSRIPLIVYHK